MKIYINTDNKISVTVTDEYGDTVTDADVTLTMVDIEGNEVAGSNWPVALEEQGEGLYHVVLPAELSLVAYQRLRCRVWAKSGTWSTYAEIPTQVAVDKT